LLLFQASEINLKTDFGFDNIHDKFFSTANLFSVSSLEFDPLAIHLHSALRIKDGENNKKIKKKL